MDKATDQAIPESEAARRFAELLAEVEGSGEPVSISRDGVPVAALVSVADVEELEQLRVDRRRAEALCNLERIAADIAADPPCSTEEEAEDLARAWGEEIHHRMNERHRNRPGEARRTA